MGQRYEVNIKKRKEILATCLSESILPKIKNALVDTRDFLVLVGTRTKYSTVGTFPKSSRGKIDAPYTQIHDLSPS